MNNIEQVLLFTCTNEQYRKNDYHSHGHMNNIDKAITRHMDK